MAYEFLTGDTIDILSFMKEAEAHGGYSKVNGTSHDYLIDWMNEHGLHAW